MSRFKIFLVSTFLLFTVTCTLSTSFAHSQTQVIEMTSWGFQPSKVSIDTNQAVIFINKDTQAHWPASDIHPTHDLYPEFDPKKAVEPGHSWAFRPKKSGEWRFHDHLFPHFNDTLIVTSEKGVNTATSSEIDLVAGFKKIADTIYTKIKNIFGLNKTKPISRDSLEKLSSNEQIKYITQLAESIGSKKAWRYIKDTYKSQAGSSGNIHDLAHLAGSLLYSENGFSGLSDCSTDFAFGCYHGFLDTAFKNNLDHLLDAQNVCMKLGLENSGPVGSCIHGIGHGVASFYGVSDLDGSLAACNKLTSGAQFCYDGVFMEFSRSAPDNFYKKDDPLYPCDRVSDQYVSSCGRNLPTVLISRFKYSFEQVVDTCPNVQNATLKESCFDALGFLAASSNSFDPQEIINSCDLILNEEFNARCKIAGAGELVFQNSPNWKEDAPKICESLNGDYQKTCLDNFQKLATEYKR